MAGLTIASTAAGDRYLGHPSCDHRRPRATVLGTPGGDELIARAVLALTLLAVASHTSAQAPTSPLLELTKQYLAAAKARDAAKVASFYAEDAVLMPPNAPPIKGKHAILQD